MSGSGDQEFDDFVAANPVEVGKPVDSAEEKPEAKAGGEAEEKPEKKPAGRRPPKPAAAPAAKPEAKAGEADEGEGDEEEEGEKEEKPEGEGDEEEEGEKEEKPEKPKRKPSERIRELTRRLRQSETLRTSVEARLEALEKGGLPKDQGGGKSGSEEVPAPDPTDVEKYPLGHLDDRYIEDKLEWLAEQKAAKRADAVLFRQQEAESAQAREREQTALLEKVDDLAERGGDIEDFQESVIEAGMRGDWDLSQPTFEAAHEAEHGAQILYELSQDKAEASRVAKLSPYQQLKFVQDRDAAISKTKGARKIPKADAPPTNTARGANSRTHINPATDNLDDFEKAWKRDEGKK